MALNLVTKNNSEWIPNVAGLLLFAKPLALRRLLPAMRVHYVRIAGIHLVEDPEQRFLTTLDLREPMLRLIPKLEASIIDDLPRHFRLEEGQMQRSDQPLLPQKFVVNALMHQDYQVNQPTLIVRYSNRIEIRNAGYSLKPEIELGEMGSVLRNPIIANVLYDIGFVETKGSGIRTIRRLLERAGLSESVFHSQILQNQFYATYLLHQFLGEEQLNWLKQFTHLNLSHDEVRVLILARETDAVDNAGPRAVTGLDILSASQVLSRLCKYDLLVKKGAGSAAHYVLASNLIENPSYLDANMSDFPEELQRKIEELGTKPRVEKLQLVLLWLCSLRSYRAEILANILKRQVTGLKSLHLSRLYKARLLDYLYPEVIHHPQQAY